MNFDRTFAVATLAVATFALAACGGGVEGTYKLDKAEVKRTMQAAMAKKTAGVPVPPGLVNVATAMIDAMEMTMELQASGRLRMKAAIPSLGPGRPGTTEDKEGTWTTDGESIMLTADGKAIKCYKSSAKLRCESGNEGDPALIFVKS